jgi:DNA helicase-2/ATP-dependent DNA helicase PcrA
MFGSTLEEPPAYLARLNERQREAASYGGRTLLVLAGAGTGKTVTLCARVAWLLGEGVPAERILLLSFTRRAARELVERARTLAQREAPTSGRIVGGTFHSVAHRLVRLHASSLGLGAGFGVLDASDAADLIDLIRQECGHAESRRRFPRAHTLLDIYSRVVNAQVPLAEVLAQHFPWCAEHHEQLGEVFRAYAARKRALGVIDLDDLLLYWRALLADAITGPGIAEGFEHVLVDEYQDVNGLQVEIVRHLSSRGAGLTVVGDDFQAIYGFRAASACHILDFPAQFADARTVKLECNYRSTNPILAVANAVSEQDRAGFPKRLWSECEGGIEPDLCFPRDDAEQAREVCERVQAARERAIDLRAQAVLFRTGHDADLLELELTRRGIPFVKYGGLRFLEAAHVKDLIALLRLLDNPADELSWFRVLQLLDGVGPTRARRMLQTLRGEAQAGAFGPHPNAAVQAPSAPAARTDLSRLQEAAALVPEGSRAHADALFGALTAAAAEAQAPPERIVECLCAAIAPLIRLRYEDGEVRVGDLEQLAASARGASDVRHFVSELVLDPPVSSADLAGPPHLDEDFLVLSTVHSAKGLEWEAVHVISAYDGNFPADMNTAGEEGVAEERRLFYVALTRARRRLHVYVPQRYYHRPGARDDGHGLGHASRFLSAHVQSLFCVSRPAAQEVKLPAQALAAARIEVSVDALFGG